MSALYPYAMFVRCRICTEIFYDGRLVGLRDICELYLLHDHASHPTTLSKCRVALRSRLSGFMNATADS